MEILVPFDRADQELSNDTKLICLTLSNGKLQSKKGKSSRKWKRVAVLPFLLLSFQCDFFPDHLIVFRAGASEGEFKRVSPLGFTCCDICG